MAELLVVDYKTFIQHIEKGGLSDLKFYNSIGTADTSYSYQGKKYATKGPYRPSDDYLLHTTLERAQIEYTILDEEFTEVENPYAYSQGIGSAIFILIPLALILVILVQSSTIKSLGKALASAKKD